MTYFTEQITSTRNRIAEYHQELGTLQQGLVLEAEHLRRRDQVGVLNALEARVLQEVEQVRRFEEAASYRFNKITLIGGVAAFSLGAIGAVVTGSVVSPISVGARLAADALSSKQPFGRVLVVVGADGIPDDVKVLNVSQEARDTGKCETEIEAGLRASGSFPMTPESFSLKMDALEQAVLEGVLTLPILGKNLSLRPRAVILFRVARHEENETKDPAQSDDGSHHPGEEL